MHQYKYFFVFVSIFLFNNKEIAGIISNEQIQSLKAPKLIQRVMSLLQEEHDRLIELQNKLQNERKQFEEEQKAIKQLVDSNHRVELYVGGTKFETRLGTLTKVPNSKLAKLFDGTYTGLVHKNQNGSYSASLDYNPKLFSHLLGQLRRLKTNEKPNFSPPLLASLVEPYNNMLKDFGLPIPSKSDDDVIALNVGGEKIATFRRTLTGIPNSKLAYFASDAKDLQRDRIGRPFLDYNPNLFRSLLNQLRDGKKITNKDLVPPTKQDQNAFQAMIKNLSQIGKIVSEERHHQNALVILDAKAKNQ